MKRVVFIAVAVCLAGIVQAEQRERESREREGRRPGRGGGEEFRAGPPRERGGGLVDRLLKDPKAAARLGLGDEQVRDLQSKMTAIEAREKELNGALQELGRKQMELLQSGNAERQAIYQIIDQIGDVRTQLAKSRIDRLFAVQSVLTDEQQSKLREQMKRRDDQGRGSRRPGGPRSGQREGAPSRRREPATRE